MQLNSIFYEENYSEGYLFADSNGYVIKEIEPDDKGRRFQIIEAPDFNKENTIQELKKTLVKYKEDVEQVELFGMQRDDYEEKKQECVNIILRLRELEK